MPLLRSNQPNAVQETSPTRKGGIFSSRSHENIERSASDTTKSNSFFGSRRHSSDSNGSRSFFASKSDPVLAAGRQKVADAEKAEKAADKALSLARSSVREAKDHVQQLEKNALEE